MLLSIGHPLGPGPLNLAFLCPEKDIPMIGVIVAVTVATAVHITCQFHWSRLSVAISSTIHFFSFSIITLKRNSAIRLISYFIKSILPMNVSGLGIRLVGLFNCITNHKC